MADADGDVVAAAASLPLADRVVHKAWKVREDAYKELAHKFAAAAEDSRVYPDFAPLLPKLARDANAPAQLLALEAAARFADRAPPALVRTVAPAVGKAVAEKALAGRPANKAKAVAAVIEFVGADAGDVVVEALVAAGFKSKTPKVVAAAVDLVREAVVTYGAGTVGVKVVAGGLGPLFGHSNEVVRKAAKALLVELHRWVGDGVKAAAKGAPDVAVKELEAAFAANAGLPRPVAVKLTRAMEERVRDMPAGDGVDGGEDMFADGGAVEEELDMSVEIDLLPRLPKMKISVEGEDEPVKDWFAAVVSKKWRVRKDALAWAADEVADARLTPGAYGDVVSRLRKILAKDSNVNVVAQAAKFVGSLASGLRGNMPQPAARALVVDLLVRIKEKNKIATVPMAAALDELHLRGCVSIAELGDEITAAAAGKVPKARSELFLWLDRCFKAGTRAADLKGAPLRMFGGVLTAATEDSTPEVRDAAIAALASLHVLVGERNMASYMEKLDNLRTGKIMAIVKELPPPRRVAPAGDGGGVPAAAPAAAAEAKAGGPVTRAGVAGAASSKAAAKAAAAPPLPAKAPRPDVSDDEGEVGVPEDDALTRTAARFDGFDAEQWTVRSFKARVAAVEVIADALRQADAVAPADAELVLAVLGVSPGLSDSNFMALKAKLELLGMVVEKCPKQLPRKTLRRLLEPAVDKLGDLKCAMTAASVFVTIAEATSARFLFEIIAKGGATTTNGRAKIGIAKFATAMVVDFGLPAVRLEAGVSLVTALLQEPPAALRSPALTLAASLAVRETPPGAVRKGLEASGQIGAPTLELFDAEIAKYGGAPDAPTRKQRFPRPAPVAVQPAAPAATRSAAQPPARAAPKSAAPPAARAHPLHINSGPPSTPGTSLGHSRVSPRAVPGAGSPRSAAVPRAPAPPLPPALILPDDLEEGAPVSVAQHFAAGSRVLAALKDANWKKRQDALAEIDAIVSDAGGFITGNIGFELMPELRRRFADSNKNIAATAYGVAGRLGQAMGPAAAPHVKIIMPAVLSSGCVDIKTTVRYAASKCLDLWFEALGLPLLIPYLASPLACINSSFRKEYLDWLVPRLSGEIGGMSPQSEDLSILLDPCLACLQDRTAEVRQLSEFTLESVAASVGFDAVEAKMAGMNKSTRLQLEPIVAKFRRPVDAGGVGAAPRGSAASPRGGCGGGLGHGRVPAPAAARAGRPRSVAMTSVMPSPRAAGMAGEQRRVGTLAKPEPSTPRSGLRRARPASMRVAPQPEPVAPLPETIAPPPEVLLKPGSGWPSRAQRALNRRAAHPAVPTVDGVVPFIPEDEVELLRDLEECVCRSLFSKMTAPANRFQLHLEAVGTIVAAMRENPEPLVECADVLLRWAMFRVDDARSPPTMVVKACEFVSNICEVLLSCGTRLDDYEASAIIPVMVDKCGSNRTAVREAMLSALLSVGDVMDDYKLMAYLVYSMGQITSIRAKLEIANGLPHVIDRVCGNGGVPPVGTMSVIAKVGYGTDEASGRAAAACIERVHSHIGDDVWAMVGEVSDNEAELLEGRFPQVGPVSGAPVAEEVAVPQPLHGGGVGTYVALPAPEFPASNLRAEDFRLSVAPGPPSNVMSAIGDSMQTPRRPVRPEFPDPEQTPALPSRRARPGGVGNFSFISSQKGSQSQSVIDQLGSSLRSEQEQGLVSLFEDISEPDSALMYKYAVEVLPLLSRGFRDCVERLEEGIADSREQHLLRQYLNALMAYVSAPSVIRGVDQTSIIQLLSDVMDAMIPDQMPKVDDWDRVRRGVNLAVLKILETCDRNLLFTALFNLLLVELRMGSDPEDKPLAKSQLLVKSVAKVTKRGFTDVSVDALLRDMNLFVTSLAPSQRWGDSLSGEGEALRLVRTVLDALLADVGPAIYDSLSLIPRHETSPLVKYIENALPPSGGVVQPADVLQEADSTDPQDKLAEIFDHMLSSGGEDAGLRRLRAFMMCYPEVDIEPHISKCSGHFQSFVRDGLAKISAENADVELKPETSLAAAERHIEHAPVSVRSSDGSVIEGQESSGQAYLKRLREIQLKYGLPELNTIVPTEEASGDESENVGAVPRGREKENGTSGTLSAAETQSKADALRQRMARIRKLAE